MFFAFATSFIILAHIKILCCQIISFYSTKIDYHVHEWFWHKLNYFYFAKFLTKYTTCAEILIIIVKLNSKVFQLLGLNFNLVR